MIDTHYDLLSIAYVAYLKNDYSYLEKISSYFNDNNVKGVIANLYFMSLEEMSKELHPKYYQKDVSVLEMFQIAKQVLDSYLPETDILYSIEGADFIKDEEELEKLYEAGLDSLVIAWNTKSKYASGNRSNQGLTELGRKLLEKAISLGMGIDLSHANPKTFSDIIKLIKDLQTKGISICCYASHSNSRSLCYRNRNLSDNQLKAILSIHGLVGVFSNRNFIAEDELKDKLSSIEKQDLYLEHIDYIASIIGKDNIMVATDDMDFCKSVDKEYGELAIYDYSTIASTLGNQLVKKYNPDIAYDIMYLNAKTKVFNKIRNNRKSKGEKIC